jgi:hypothetical protein
MIIMSLEIRNGGKVASRAEERFELDHSGGFSGTVLRRILESTGSGFQTIFRA